VALKKIYPSLTEFSIHGECEPPITNRVPRSHYNGHSRQWVQVRVKAAASQVNQTNWINNAGRPNPSSRSYFLVCLAIKPNRPRASKTGRGRTSAFAMALNNPRG